MGGSVARSEVDSESFSASAFIPSICLSLGMEGTGLRRIELLDLRGWAGAVSISVGWIGRSID